jgi:hypothetical protein
LLLSLQLLLLLLVRPWKRPPPAAAPGGVCGLQHHLLLMWRWYPVLTCGQWQTLPLGQLDFAASQLGLGLRPNALVAANAAPLLC